MRIKYSPLPDTSQPDEHDQAESSTTMQRLYSRSDDGGETASPSSAPKNAIVTTEEHNLSVDTPAPAFQLYRTRFLGLAQLVLLNLIVSWDWLTFAPLSTTASIYFSRPVSSINWLSTAFLFAFLPVAPIVLWVLNRHGPKTSILVASALVLVGNWIRYAGTRSVNFPVVMMGQVLIGFAQPFVLAAPTRYSALWFSDSGRVTATAIASLANPLGGALGQLVGPLWASEDPHSMPKLVLYTSILSTIAALPAPLIPSSPRTPPSALAAEPRLELREAMARLPGIRAFWLLVIPFSVYVGAFNSTSSLLNQILAPHAFSELDAGIAGGLLILVGLIASAMISPIVDKTHSHLLVIKLLVPLIAAAYIVLRFLPPTRSVPAVYTICAVLGATSFSLLPAALEYLVLVTHPVSAEVTSVIGWSGGQLLGAILIVVMNAMQSAGADMTKALVLQAVVCAIVVPLPLMLGVRRFGLGLR